MSDTALQLSAPGEQGDAVALRNAIRVWARSTTGQLAHNPEALVRDKRKAVELFFSFVGKSPERVDATDVEGWRNRMEEQGLKPNTVYTRVSLLAAFFQWLMRDPELGRHLRQNPARAAMPKRPQSYQTESTKAYTDEEMNALVAAVKAEAEGGSVKAKRDYALLLIYFFSGLRRREVISLRGRDVEIKDEGMVLHYRRKGGRYQGRELLEPSAVASLVAYLEASGRVDVLGSERPLWTRHDRAGRAGAPLCSHAFAKNLKAYGDKAGVKSARIHRTRHTFGRLVAEQTGSLVETQDALDHANLSTTRVYVERIVVKKDKYSKGIAERMGDKTTYIRRGSCIPD
ncbi:MAG: tyrosine-type recombinase/integrase [Acidobacteria bacterium]|nr:tyrosine-type recombinase/integrase [Acidobacteriota bacterium]